MTATPAIGVRKMIIIGWNAGVRTVGNIGKSIAKIQNTAFGTITSTEKSTKNMDNMDKKEAWFAWYPVKTKENKIAWMRKVIRVWNPNTNLTVFDPDDPGFYEGSWEYYG